jgi:hypothetical protein
MGSPVDFFLIFSSGTVWQMHVYEQSAAAGTFLLFLMCSLHSRAANPAQCTEKMPLRIAGKVKQPVHRGHSPIDVIIKLSPVAVETMQPSTAGYHMTFHFSGKQKYHILLIYRTFFYSLPFFRLANSLLILFFRKRKLFSFFMLSGQ